MLQPLVPVCSRKRTAALAMFNILIHVIMMPVLTVMGTDVANE